MMYIIGNSLCQDKAVRHRWQKSLSNKARANTQKSQAAIPYIYNFIESPSNLPYLMPKYTIFLMSKITDKIAVVPLALPA